MSLHIVYSGPAIRAYGRTRPRLGRYMVIRELLGLCRTVGNISPDPPPWLPSVNYEAEAWLTLGEGIACPLVRGERRRRRGHVPFVAMDMLINRELTEEVQHIV